MRILMTGATGLIGREIGQRLAARGDTLVCLVRDPVRDRARLPFPAERHAWDHGRDVPAEALADVDAVIHLAGEPIADGRWSAAKKARVLDSRVEGTRRLVAAVLEHGPAVKAFVHGSAIGFWGERGDETVDASSPRGDGFLAEVSTKWEAELAPLSRRSGLRVPIVRTGVVLARESGALPEMLPVFRLGFGGRLGDGRAWMSWIHRDDIAGLFVHALDRGESGVLEGVAPSPVTNAQFTRALCQALGVREGPPAPALALKAAFGEKADLVLGSTRVEPRATLASGYAFRHATIDSAMADLLSPLRDGTRERTWVQWLPQPPETLWPFYGDARNLESITPPFLNFRVLGQSTPETCAGTRFEYRLRLNGIPFGWRTLIESWDAPRRFVDVQESGPFALWHHAHDFEPFAGGTRVTDTVRYRLPGGWLGAAAGGCKVDADVGRIFDFRARALDERFGN